MGQLSLKSLIKNKRRRRLVIALAIVIALLILLAVRASFLSGANLRAQVEYTRVLLDAMEIQDAKKAQEVIDAKQEALRLNEEYADTYGSEDDAEDVSGEVTEEGEP